MILGPTLPCRCGIQVTRRQTRRGGTIMLEPRPDPVGHHVIRDGVAVALNDRDRTQVLAAGELVYRSHFERCRKAAMRRAGRRTA